MAVYDLPFDYLKTYNTSINGSFIRGGRVCLKDTYIIFCIVLKVLYSLTKSEKEPGKQVCNEYSLILNICKRRLKKGLTVYHIF